MGNNAAFSAFEQTVVSVYNHGALTKPLLKELIQPYRDQDTDSGGMEGLLSKKDKLDVIDIVIKTWGQTPPPMPRLPKDHKTWTPEQYTMNDQWQEERWSMFDKITQFS